MSSNRNKKVLLSQKMG